MVRFFYHAQVLNSPDSIKSLKSLYRSVETPGSYFISLEGIEGSGKTTQIEELKTLAQKKNLRVLTLREPGGTRFGEKLREAVLGSQTPLHPLAECHLFLASRAQLLKEQILPFLLNPGSVVILDRYIDSTLAYQGKARSLGFNTILTLHQFDPLNLLPHRTYFLDISLETSLKRQQLRGNLKDYFEQEELLFYEKLISGYHEIAEMFEDRILRINGELSSQEVSSLIISDFENIIK